MKRSVKKGTGIKGKLLSPKRVLSMILSSVMLFTSLWSVGTLGITVNAEDLLSQYYYQPQRTWDEKEADIAKIVTKAKSEPSTPSGSWDQYNRASDTDVQHAALYPDGKGTSSYPFLINTAEQLVNMRAGKSYRLIADIDLGPHYWTPKSVVSADNFFDADGYIISNVFIDDTATTPETANCGFFRKNDSRIFDMIIVNVDIIPNAAATAVGTICGSMTKNGTVGRYCSFVSDCRVVNVNIHSMADRSSATAATVGFGGLVGYAMGYLSNNVVEGLYLNLVNARNVGGVFGNCVTTSMQTRDAGIRPYRYTDSGDNKEIGVNVVSSGGTNAINIGGFAGTLTGNTIIEFCYSENALVQGYSTVGGFIGNANAATTTYDQCFATGIVTVDGNTTANTAGGFIGTLTGASTVVSNSYSQVSVSCGNTITDVGGLIGSVMSVKEIKNNYITGQVTGGGIFIGNMVSTTATGDNNFYNSEANNSLLIIFRGAGSAGFSSKISGQTALELKQDTTFAGWDLDKIWTIASGNYPELKNTAKVVPYEIDPRPYTPGQPELPREWINSAYDYSMPSSGKAPIVVQGASGLPSDSIGLTNLQRMAKFSFVTDNELHKLTKAQLADFIVRETNFMFKGAPKDSVSAILGTTLYSKVSSAFATGNLAQKATALSTIFTNDDSIYQDVIAAYVAAGAEATAGKEAEVATCAQLVDASNAAGADLTAALNAAVPGDVIILEAGKTYAGNFTLPYKRGNDWIYIVSDQLAALPKEGTRIDIESDQTLMPRLISPIYNVTNVSGVTHYTPTNHTLGTVTAADCANHYRFSGIELTTSLINLDSNSESIVTLTPGGPIGLYKSKKYYSNNFTFDRCYVHGHPLADTTTGINIQSSNVAIVDSAITEIHSNWRDAKAIGGTSIPGPIKIVNNRIEASTENIILGGGTAANEKTRPQDIEIRNNYFNKPNRWDKNDPSYEGIKWEVKNLFELKMADRILIDGNIFENVWDTHSDQHGFAILMTTRSQSGDDPYSVTNNVTFTNNIMKRCNAGMQLHLHTNTAGKTTRISQNVLIKNNLMLIEDWAVVQYDRKYQLQVSGASKGIVVDHNSFFSPPECNAKFPGTGPILLSSTEGKGHSDFSFTNNISSYGKYGPPNNDALSSLISNHFVSSNVFGDLPAIGANPYLFPAGNFYEKTMADIGLDFKNGKYLVPDGSPYKNAGTDGKDIGLDWKILSEKTATVEKGEYYNAYVPYLESEYPVFPYPSYPTYAPTPTPTDTPTATPTATPTDTPTATPTATPTDTLTPAPTDTPIPTDTPTATPTATPTDTPTATPIPTPIPSFTDISGHWGAVYIDALAAKGIMSGYKMDDGTLQFRPDNSMQRQEFAKIVTVAFDVYNPAATSTFTDCPVGQWFTPYVGSLQAEGLTSGRGDGTYGVGDNMSRQDTATMLSRAMVKYRSITLPDAAAADLVVADFTDADQIASYAKPPVAFFVTAGIIKGSETSQGSGVFNFRPTANITRAEISKIMDMSLKYVDP